MSNDPSVPCVHAVLPTMAAQHTLSMSHVDRWDSSVLFDLGWRIHRTYLHPSLASSILHVPKETQSSRVSGRGCHPCSAPPHPSVLLPAWNRAVQAVTGRRRHGNIAVPSTYRLGRGCQACLPPNRRCLPTQKQKTDEKGTKMESLGICRQATKLLAPGEASGPLGLGGESWDQGEKREW